MRLNLDRGRRFDRSFTSISAAVDDRGVFLERRLFVERELKSGSLVTPFELEGLRMSCHNMTYLSSSARLPKISSFPHWLFSELDDISPNPPREG